MEKPREYYLKFIRKGRTYYADGKHFDLTGEIKRASAAKVKKSKKKVVQFSFQEKRIKTPEEIKSSRVSKEETISGKIIIQGYILSQSVKKAILIAHQSKKRFAVKWKNKLSEIKTNTSEKLTAFLDFTDAIQSAYFDCFGDVIESPLFFIRYIEGKKGLVFDYDDTLIGKNNILQKEFPDEYELFIKTIKRIFNKFI